MFTWWKKYKRKPIFFSKWARFVSWKEIVMAVPKKKMSKSRTKRRKAMHKISRPHFLIDPETGFAKQSHRVNPVDGTYNGRQVKEPNNE